MKVISLSALIIGLAMITGVGIYFAKDPCGPLRERYAQKDYSEIQYHIEATERSLQNNIAAPSYLIAQLKSDLRQLQTNRPPACFHKMQTALECAVQSEIAYADKWSLEGGNPVAEQARKQYQSCMSDYYFALEDLKGKP